MFETVLLNLMFSVNVSKLLPLAKYELLVMDVLNSLSCRLRGCQWSP